MAGAFLHVLSDDARGHLVRVADRRRWPVGAIVFHEGDAADRVVVIETGIVKAVAASEAGVESVLADRVRDASRRQVEFGSFDTSVRVARLLAELGSTYGEASDAGIRLNLLSQDELASLCAASRDAVARSLRTLRDAGLIETGRRRVTIRDLRALRRWSPT